MWRKGDKPIPDYTLEGFLGRGTFGEVWKARHANGGVFHALKFIELNRSAGLKEYRGIQRVKQIRHANLLEIHGIWALDQENCVLSEEALAALEAEGGAKRPALRGTMTVEQVRPTTLVVAMSLGDISLWDLYRDLREAGEKIPVDELLSYFYDAARGIDHLNKPIHDLGGGTLVAIQHCDIKPANIVLMGDSAKVCDFGLAHILAHDGAAMTGAGDPRGTLAYMSPECVHGAPSSASDQYSLAIAYYELRTGELPFFPEDQSMPKLFTAHTEGRLDLSRLEEPEREVIRKATSVDPSERYASAREMVLALRRAVGVEYPFVDSGGSSKGSSVGGTSSVTKPPPPPASRRTAIQDTVNEEQRISDTGEPVTLAPVEATSASPHLAEAVLAPAPSERIEKLEPPAPPNRRAWRHAASLVLVCLLAAGGVAVRKYVTPDPPPKLWRPMEGAVAFRPVGAKMVTFNNQNYYERIEARLNEETRVEFVFVKPPNYDPIYIMTEPVSQGAIDEYIRRNGLDDADSEAEVPTYWLEPWRKSFEEGGPQRPAAYVPGNIAMHFAHWLCGVNHGDLPSKDYWSEVVRVAGLEAAEPADDFSFWEWTKDFYLYDPTIDPNPFTAPYKGNRTIYVYVVPSDGAVRRDGVNRKIVADPCRDVTFRAVIRIPLKVE